MYPSARPCWWSRVKKGSSERSLWAKGGTDFTASPNTLSWNVPTKIIKSNSSEWPVQGSNPWSISTLLLPIEVILVMRDSPDLCWAPADIPQCMVSPSVGWQSLSPLPVWVNPGWYPSSMGSLLYVDKPPGSQPCCHGQVQHICTEPAGN